MEKRVGIAELRAAEVRRICTSSGSKHQNTNTRKIQQRGKPINSQSSPRVCPINDDASRIAVPG